MPAGLSNNQDAALDAIAAPAGLTHAPRIKALLARDAKPVSLAAGELLFEHGDTAETAWVLVDGSLEEWRDETPAALRKPHTCVGELALLHPGSRRRTEVRARQDSELLAIPAELYLAAAHGPGGHALTEAAGHHARELTQALHKAFLRLRLAELPERHSPDPALEWDLAEALLTPVTLPTWASARFPEHVHPSAPGTWLTADQGWLLTARDAGPLRSTFTALLAPVETVAPVAASQGVLLLAAWTDDFFALTWQREVLGWPTMYGRAELDHLSILGGGHRRISFRTEGGQAWALAGQHRNFGPAAAATALRLIVPDPTLAGVPLTTATQVATALDGLAPLKLIWRRSTYTPGLQAGAGPTWAWDAADFTSDELVSMLLATTLSTSGLSLLALADPGLDIERPCGASLRCQGKLVSTGVQLELDYKATYAGQPPPGKLAWGPGAWLPPGYVSAPSRRPRPVDARRFRLREGEQPLSGLSASQETLARALAREPELERLSTQELEALVQVLLPVPVPTTALDLGDELFLSGGAPGAQVWVVLDGRVSLWRSDVLLEERVQGQMLGVEPLQMGGSYLNTARAARPSVLQPVDSARVTAAAALSDTFRRWIGGSPLSALNQAEVLASIQEGASGSLFVGPQGHLLPGPYTAADVEMVTLLVGPPDQPTPLPPGVSGGPLHEPTEWMLLLTRFSDFSHPALPSGLQSYTEVALTRRVWVKGKAYRWFTVLKPDNLMALSSGREIYGYPKLWDKAQFTGDRIRLRRSSGALDVAWREGNDGHLINQLFNPLLAGASGLAGAIGEITQVPFLSRRRVPRLRSGPWTGWDAGDWHQDALCLTWMKVEALEEVQFLVRKDPGQHTLQLPLDSGTVLNMDWDGTLWRSRTRMSLQPTDEVVLDYLEEPLSPAEKARLKDW